MRPGYALLAVILAVAAPGWGQPAIPVPSPIDAPAFVDWPDPDKEANTWAHIHPMQMLEILKQHPGRTMWLYWSPPGWISAGDVDKLRGLTGSKVPAAVTCPFIAAHMPRRGTSSTIGREARGMIKAAERGATWPSGCSDL